MNVLFDFDGVLFDSSWEVTVIIILTYMKAFPDSKISLHQSTLKTSEILRHLNRYDPNYAFRIVQKQNKKLNNCIKKLRTYCIDVDDFFIVSSLIDQNYPNLENLTYKVINHKFYYSYKNDLIQKRRRDLDLFIDSFYESRKYIKEANREFWLLLTPPYENQIKFFTQICQKHEVGILSTKQKYAILSILQYYGINIDPNKVFAKENKFIDKGKKIKEIMNLWAARDNELHFVDDLLENLLKVKSCLPNVSLYMASWGYNNYYHRLIAKKSGIKIIDTLAIFT
ncbi:MAG: hypothetical protein RMJ51_06565 [Candidatus Calescibacterium sp.]|nr:hypothetical protein [Candidatus Calescibacterium sp.]MCX7972806.1 hypothetical protein [bacterium]MDW8195880.1 hypothetical protein [Candidatus Calescibacterium sp.]